MNIFKDLLGIIVFEPNEKGVNQIHNRKVYQKKCCKILQFVL